MDSHGNRRRKNAGQSPFLKLPATFDLAPFVLLSALKCSASDSSTADWIDCPAWCDFRTPKNSAVPSNSRVISNPDLKFGNLEP